MSRGKLTTRRAGVVLGDVQEDRHVVQVFAALPVARIAAAAVAADEQEVRSASMEPMSGGGPDSPTRETPGGTVLATFHTAIAATEPALTTATARRQQGTSARPWRRWGVVAGRGAPRSPPRTARARRAGDCLVPVMSLSLGQRPFLRDAAGQCLAALALGAGLLRSRLPQDRIRQGDLVRPLGSSWSAPRSRRRWHSDRCWLG